MKSTRLLNGMQNPLRNLHLSPSELHNILLENNVPALRFDNGDVWTWQNRLRRKLRQLVGEIPKKRLPLNPRTLWRQTHPLGIIEKIILSAEPGSDILAYVCLPHAMKPPYTFMICLQGHSTGMHNSIGVDRENEFKPILVEGDRDFALQCLNRGLAALCVEQRSLGLRREQKQKLIAAHGCHDAAMHSLMLGRTLIGERVFDVDRGIDYLCQRGDADPNRIGVMGDSGGGNISVFSAALLPRITFAMPASYFCTFKDSIMKIRHCADNYIPNLIRYAEMADILGLFAPKPVVVVSGRDDPIFPVQATRQAFRQLKQIYRACGLEGRCHLVIGDGGHRFFAQNAWPVMLREIENLPQSQKLARAPAPTR